MGEIDLRRVLFADANEVTIGDEAFEELLSRGYAKVEGPITAKAWHCHLTLVLEDGVWVSHLHSVMAERIDFILPGSTCRISSTVFYDDLLVNISQHPNNVSEVVVG